MSGHCVLCGQPWGTHGTACQLPPIVTIKAQPTYEGYPFTSYTLTETDIRRIVREELKLAKEKT